MKKKKLLILLGSICLVVVLAALLLPACAKEAPPAPAPTPAPAPAPVLHWKFQSAYAPIDAAYYIHSVEWAKMVEEASDGRVDVELFVPGALCPILEGMSAIGKGVLEAGLGFGMFHTGKVPAGDIESELPWGAGDPLLTWESHAAGVELFFEWGLRELLQEVYAEHNVRISTHHPSGVYTFNTIEPIRKAEDFKGRKLRAGGVLAKLVEKLGAAATIVPGGEAYMALKLGTVDGVAGNEQTMKGFRSWEVAKYFMYPGISHPTVSIWLNLDAWNNLPEDVRKAISGRERQLSLQTSYAYALDCVAVLDKAVKEEGVQVITLSEEETAKLRKVGIALWDEIAAKDDYCARGVQILKEFNRAKGRM